MNGRFNNVSVLFAIVAGLFFSSKYVLAQSVVPPQRLYLHGFRSPSIGIEYRRGNIGLHSGLYLTNFSLNETTRFLKTGVTVYFPSLDLSRSGKSEAYLSAAYVRGLNRDFENRNGIFLEPGMRWQFRNRFEARLGVGILASSGQRIRVNPTPGISWSIPLN
jgi:hypothetical protein